MEKTLKKKLEPPRSAARRWCTTLREMGHIMVPKRDDIEDVIAHMRIMMKDAEFSAAPSEDDRSMLIELLVKPEEKKAKPTRKLTAKAARKIEDEADAPTRQRKPTSNKALMKALARADVRPNGRPPRIPGNTSYRVIAKGLDLDHLSPEDLGCRMGSQNTTRFKNRVIMVNSRAETVGELVAELRKKNWPIYYSVLDLLKLRDLGIVKLGE